MSTLNHGYRYRMLIGAVLIAIGVLVSVMKWDEVDKHQTIDSWPVALVITGSLSITYAQTADDYIAGSILIMVGALLIFIQAVLGSKGIVIVSLVVTIMMLKYLRNNKRRSWITYYASAT